MCEKESESEGVCARESENVCIIMSEIIVFSMLVYRAIINH